jgi:hypothetical protein
MLFELNGNVNVLLLQKENNTISFEMTMKWQWTHKITICNLRDSTEMHKDKKKKNRFENILNTFPMHIYLLNTSC